MWSRLCTSREEERGGFISDPLRELEELGVSCSVGAVRPCYKESVEVAEGAPFARWVRYPACPGNMGLSGAGRFLYWRLRNLVGQLHRRTPIHVLHAPPAFPCASAALPLG